MFDNEFKQYITAKVVDMMTTFVTHSDNTGVLNTEFSSVQ